VLSHCCNEPNASGGSPPESSIALATFAGFNQSDLNGFVAHNGMAYYYNVFRIDGTSGEPGTECNIGASGCATVTVDDEATLDIEYSTASSNSYGSYLDTAHVFMYEGANDLYNTYADIYNFMLNDGHAKVMSTSWSGTEATSGNDLTYWEDADDAIYTNMVAAGWTLIGDADDQGSTGNCSTISVNFPASDPNFIAAGGTELGLYSNGDWDGEVAWTGGTNPGDCGSNDGGGGGGVSAVFAQPYWQNTYSSLGSKRLMPDISLNAGGIGENYYYNGTLSPVGGTSIVAPELAGFFAQENSYLDYIGNVCGSEGNTACSPVGLANPYFYEASTSGSHVPFYDITSGCTSNDATIANDLTAWCAGTGYDLATGLGSANMMQLAWGINWELIPAYGLPAITFNSTPPTNTWLNSDQIVGWTVADTNTDTSITATPSGIAGFTQGWDSIPSDSYSEPHGGSGDSFYSGPEFAFATSGCLSFNGDGGCSAGGGQGCHTVYVEAWDNQGRTSTQGYGPVCYDTVAPTVTPSTNPPTSGTVWVNKSVTVTLAASDPGGSNASGIQTTYYGIDSGCVPGNVGACTTYSGPFVEAAAGQNYIYYFTVDNAGNTSPQAYIWVSIDETAPTTTATLGGTVLSGSTYDTAVSVTLNASDTGGSGVAHTYYTLDGGAQTTYSGSAFNVSTIGGHTVKYWSVDAAGNVESTHTLTFTIYSQTTATLVASPSTVYQGQSVKMTATIGAQLAGAPTPTGSVIFYNGSTNLGTVALSGGTASLSTTSLPAGALTLQVTYTPTGDYVTTNSAPFDETVNADTAAMTSPAPGSILTGASATFNWTAGYGVTQYNVHIGTTGVGSTNVATSGSLTTLNYTASNIPTIGGTLYVRLYSFISGAWQYVDYTYTEANLSAPAVMSTPAPNSTLTGSSATFTWTTGSNVTQYNIHVGTTGAGSSNILSSGTLHTTSDAVTGIPTIGGTLYVRLYSFINGAWQYNDYTYTEYNTPTPAAMSTPAPSSTLTGSSATFTWTAGVGVTEYNLHVGTTGAGSTNIIASGDLTTLSDTVSGIPTTGGTLYVRLYSLISGAWQYHDYTYTEFTSAVPAVMVSPTPSSTLTGSSVTFTWTAGTGVTEYNLHVGTTGAGSTNIAASGDLTTLTDTISGIPTTGGTLYVRLYSLISGAWQYHDYTYTEQ